MKKSKIHTIMLEELKDQKEDTWKFIISKKDEKNMYLWESSCKLHKEHDQNCQNCKIGRWLKTKIYR